MPKYLKLKNIDKKTKDKLIGLAWDDRTSFDQIKKDYGFTEDDIINLMRRELKPGSWRLWRKRVSGRLTKHEKPFKDYLSTLKSVNLKDFEY
jgi:uncharacterized protein (TIGR03643 family)